MNATFRGVCILFLGLAFLPARGGGQAQSAVGNDNAVAAGDPDAAAATSMPTALRVDSATSGSVETAASGLPDAPIAGPGQPSAESGPSSAQSFFGVTSGRVTGNPANRFHRVIQPNEVVSPLDSGDKFELAIMSRFTMGDVAATLFSAGFSQLHNGAPHYGTDSGAFGERLGALALKQTTQSIFNYGVYDSLFHDDPRYYIMGPQRNAGVRALYSASCVFITQKDDGKTAVNWPKFAAMASATALTTLYYPPRDHGFAHERTSFEFSILGSVLSNEIHEFIGDGFRLLRHQPE